MKIYTKTGDKGETGIIGRRLIKSDPTIQAIGEMDELNASIGICIVLLKNNLSDLNRMEYSKILNILVKIQSNIFAAGGVLASGNINIDFEQETQDLEKSIDLVHDQLEPLKNFILPGGSLLSSHIHLSRTICRRAERGLVQYLELISIEKVKYKKEIANKNNISILKYFNRMSDYLFTLARYINKLDKIEDILWIN